MIGRAASAPPAPADQGAAFDPDDHTVAEVEAYVADHPDERDDILAAERAGKNRSTLIAALETDEPEEPEP